MRMPFCAFVNEPVLLLGRDCLGCAKMEQTIAVADHKPELVRECEFVCFYKASNCPLGVISDGAMCMVQCLLCYLVTLLR